MSEVSAAAIIEVGHMYMSDRNSDVLSLGRSAVGGQILRYR